MQRIVRVMLLALLALLASRPAAAQTPATYSDRAKLAQSADFIGRVSIAAMVGAIAVVTEDAGTPDHGVRVKLAAYVLKEPEFVARRLAHVLSATVTATTDAEGLVSTPLTDAQLQTVVASRWTVLSGALLGGGQ